MGCHAGRSVLFNHLHPVSSLPGIQDGDWRECRIERDVGNCENDERL